VMRNATTGGERQLGGSDVKVAVHLEGVAVDDFAVEPFSEQKCQIALSGSGGTDHCNQGSFRCVCVYGVWGISIQTPLYNEKMVFEPSRDAAWPKRE